MLAGDPNKRPLKRVTSVISKSRHTTHVFNDPSEHHYDEEIGKYKKTCKECGFVLMYEKL
jgi:hypothetical protein